MSCKIYSSTIEVLTIGGSNFFTLVSPLKTLEPLEVCDFWFKMSIPSDQPASNLLQVVTASTSSSMDQKGFNLNIVDLNSILVPIHVVTSAGGIDISGANVMIEGDDTQYTTDINSLFVFLMGFGFVGFTELRRRIKK